MDRLKALLAKLQNSLAQLSDRERLIVQAGGACFVVFCVSVAYTTMSRSIARHELAIVEKTGQLQKVAVYAQTYAQSERARKDLEAKLSGPPVRLMTQLQSLAEKHGLTISAMNDHGEQNLDQVKESLVELQISQAPVDRLTEMLNDIEHDPKIIRVRKLRLRQTSSDPNALNAILTIGTYQLLQKG